MTWVVRSSEEALDRIEVELVWPSDFPWLGEYLVVLVDCEEESSLFWGVTVMEPFSLPQISSRSKHEGAIEVKLLAAIANAAALMPNGMWQYLAELLLSRCLSSFTFVCTSDMTDNSGLVYRGRILASRELQGYSVPCINLRSI
jgi:hypothetical protein